MKFFVLSLAACAAFISNAYATPTPQGPAIFECKFTVRVFLHLSRTDERITSIGAGPDVCVIQ